MKISAILLATVALAQNAYLPTTTISNDNFQPTTISNDNYQAPAHGNDYKTPLKCWHCDAMSYQECANKGQEETCLVSFQKKYYTFYSNTFDM